MREADIIAQNIPDYMAFLDENEAKYDRDEARLRGREERNKRVDNVKQKLQRRKTAEPQGSPKRHSAEPEAAPAIESDSTHELASAAELEAAKPNGVDTVSWLNTPPPTDVAQDAPAPEVVTNRSMANAPTVTSEGEEMPYNDDADAPTVATGRVMLSEEPVTSDDDLSQLLGGGS